MTTYLFFFILLDSVYFCYFYLKEVLFVNIPSDFELSGRIFYRNKQLKFLLEKQYKYFCESKSHSKEKAKESKKKSNEHMGKVEVAMGPIKLALMRPIVPIGYVVSRLVIASIARIERLTI